ncbi:MAG: hypothetical protein JWN56_2744 [Sphingobacteriales bacterium]|nr:hypothetical protein [Sphingobacteriales bacterium]
MLKKTTAELMGNHWTIEVEDSTSGFTLYNIYRNAKFYDCILWEEKLNHFHKVGNYDKDHSTFQKLTQIIMYEFHVSRLCG